MPSISIRQTKNVHNHNRKIPLAHPNKTIIQYRNIKNHTNPLKNPSISPITPRYDHTLTRTNHTILPPLHKLIIKSHKFELEIKWIVNYWELWRELWEIGL
jgi:hypothetical protein